MALNAFSHQQQQQQDHHHQDFGRPPGGGFALRLRRRYPSVQVGVLHTTNPTTSIDTANNTATATNWLVGGSLTASFPQTGVVLEPCASLTYNTATASSSGTTGIAVPSGVCVEVDTATASMR